MKKTDLIEQVVWLLERMPERQVLQVLATANRIFVQTPTNLPLQQTRFRSLQSGRENVRPE